jgi:adenylate kinase family enzyme
MGVKLFILGRPGSGKSTAARYFQQIVRVQGLTAAHFNDYDILREMFLADHEHKRFRPTEHNGFDAIDLSVLDSALEELEKRITNTFPTPDLVTIEFARNDYATALRCFSASFLKDAYLLYLDADIATCLRRVHERVMNSQTQDDHPSFSDEIFRNYYARDNRPFIRHSAQRKFGLSKGVRLIDNRGPLKEFLLELAQCADTILVEVPELLISSYK